MAKRRTRCHCPKTRTCHKRKGSPRFTAPCKARFRTCQKETLKATGSMRTAGKKCMTELQRCAGGRSAKRAIRKYQRVRDA
jgi:hypothetical protein